jgi:hypothetical protein
MKHVLRDAKQSGATIDEAVFSAIDVLLATHGVAKAPSTSALDLIAAENRLLGRPS